MGHGVLTGVIAGTVCSRVVKGEWRKRGRAERFGGTRPGFVGDWMRVIASTGDAPEARSTVELVAVRAIEDVAVGGKVEGTGTHSVGEITLPRELQGVPDDCAADLRRSAKQDVNDSGDVVSDLVEDDAAQIGAPGAVEVGRCTGIRVGDGRIVAG